MSNRYKKEAIHTCRRLLKQGPLKCKKRSRKQLLEEVMGIKVQQCPRCKMGKMVVVETLAPLYTQYMDSS